MAAVRNQTYALVRGGRVEGPLLPAVRAFVDWRLFGVPPWGAGGLWGVDDELAEQLREAARVSAEHDAEVAARQRRDRG